MRKSEKQDIRDMLATVRSRFRPMEMDKMTIGDWKLLDDAMSRMILKLDKELEHK